MVYIIVAIPLMLLTLTRFGNWLLSLVHQIGFGWLFIRGKEDGTSRSNFNLLCGITLAASWILLSAAIFYGCECYQDSVDKLAPASYFTSLYFVMISLMTVGLGDIDFKDKKFTIFYFTIIFIGTLSADIIGN